MVSRKIRILSESGLHMRPAGALCGEAGRYDSKISLTLGDITVNAKSVISVLGACVKCGDEILLTCEGEDEQQALEGLIAVIKREPERDA